LTSYLGRDRLDPLLKRAVDDGSIDERLFMTLILVVSIVASSLRTVVSQLLVGRSTSLHSLCHFPLLAADAAHHVKKLLSDHSRETADASYGNQVIRSNKTKAAKKATRKRARK
jgi:hypothetical protein